jgi:Mg2+-importing ATPase
MDKENLNDLKFYSEAKIEAVYNKLNTSEKGLSDLEAKNRLIAFGPNIITEGKRANVFLEFLGYFKNPLIIILLAAALVSSFLGERVNALIIFLMVLFSGALDFVEEHSASRAAKKLKEKVKTTAAVTRNGQTREIEISQICVGDIVVLNAGDLVPADCRVISAKDLFIDQSALTGESFPSEKTAEVARNEEKNNILYLGTNVVSGEAVAVVVKTGKETEFGKIAETLVRNDHKSEFEVGVAKFGIFIVRIVFFLVLFIFFFNALKNFGSNPETINFQLVQSFLFAVAIAVGVTPELLPMIMSVTMARGSLKMSRKGVIVKKLGAIPSFGSMDVLCTDKTGTLTENKIKLVTYTDVTGKTSQDVLLHAYLNSYHESGIENSLDEALLSFKKFPTEQYKKIDELPFDFNRKMMSVVIAGPRGQMMIAKGSPESVFERSIYYRANARKAVFGDRARSQARSQYEKLSRDGHRVLAVAIKRLEKTKAVYCKKDECGLELLGFVSFFDPAKAGVKEALENLSEIGIEMKIITGDNELVTQKICGDVGLPIKGILLGCEIDKMMDGALQAKVEAVTVFARCSPIQKNRIINALKARHRVVSYLGDGINDAPSLKAADVGISVNNAVDVAKESADIVLTKKDLGVLKDGVIEGRKVFGNTMKYIMMGLSSNFGNMFSAAGAVVFLPFLPMLPIQILLNNFLYDLSQITIPFDNVDKEWVQKPHRWNLQFIKKFMYFFGPVSSLFDFVTFFILFKVFAASEPLFQTGWFMESLATQVFVIHIIRTKQVPFVQSRPSKYLLASTIFCVALGWVIPSTVIGKFFQFKPLPLEMIAAIVLIVAVYLVLVEAVKRIFYRRHFNLI